MQSFNNSSFGEEMSMGVRLSSRPITTMSERDGKATEKRVADNVIQELPWTLNNMLERFSFQDTLSWLSAQPSHTVLKKIRIPQDLLTTSISATPFDRFTYWRGNVELQFQVTSNPLTQGLLVAFFVPLSSTRFIDSTIVPNFSNVSLNQAVYLYANTNTAAKMIISFNSPQAYLDLTQEEVTTRNSLGYVYIMVMNRIQLAAMASDTTSVSYFSRFLDNEFKVPRMSLAIARPQAMSMLASAATSVLTQHKSTPANGSKSVLRSIADKLIPKGLIGDVIDGAMGIFGLDKPTDPNLQLPLQVLGTQRMNFAQGIESIDKLTLYPAQTYESNHETFATDVDEMDFNYLKKKYTYLGSFDFSTAHTKGQVIGSWPINPMPSEFFNQAITQVPLVSYISIPFQFWKGGFSYKIQFVATSFQTGKLFFAINFNQYSPATIATGLGPLTSQYGQAFELNQGSNEVEFAVPYVANTPYLDVPNSNVPSVEDTIGYINIVVLNPLVAPNNTPTTITGNVFVAAADDFELSTLTMSNNLVPVQPRQLELDDIAHEFEVVARPQSAIAPLATSENEVNLAMEELVAPNTTTVERIDTTQLAPLSVKNLLKKYQMLAILPFPLPTPERQGNMLVIPISTLFGTDTIGTDPLPQDTFKLRAGLWTHFQLLYRQIRGPLRFKLMINGVSPQYSFSMFYQPPSVVNAGTGAQIDTLGNEMFMPEKTVAIATDYNGRAFTTRVRTTTRLPISYVNGVQKTAEFEIPFSSKFLSLISWTGGSSENELEASPLIDMGSIVLYGQNVPGDYPENVLVHVFMALGDETRFGNVFQIPSVAVNNLTNAGGSPISSAWPDSYGTGAPISNTLMRL
nr:MAG: RNA-dependent RNA polymerase [Riboviria sp.]